jgi:predicted enzyme related to lactoylglutathione lyase
VSASVLPRVQVRVQSLVLDTTDLERASRFWTHLLGVQVLTREPEWIDFTPIGGDGLPMALQLVPEDKAVKNRLHLDLATPDVVAAGERAALLGATPLGPLHTGDGAPWRVWCDPEGNEFCFVTA